MHTSTGGESGVIMRISETSMAIHRVSEDRVISKSGAASSVSIPLDVVVESC